MLDTPVTELPMGNQVNVLQHLGDAGSLLKSAIDEKKRNAPMYLILFQAVLENVLNNETASFTKGHLMPHSSQRFVDILHNLGWGANPAKFEQLLPNMTGVCEFSLVWTYIL